MDTLANIGWLKTPWVHKMHGLGPTDPALAFLRVSSKNTETLKGIGHYLKSIVFVFFMLGTPTVFVYSKGVTNRDSEWTQIFCVSIPPMTQFESALRPLLLIFFLLLVCLLPSTATAILNVNTFLLKLQSPINIIFYLVNN